MQCTMVTNKQKKDVFIDNKQSLQERLHTLLTRLSDSGEILKKWPETKTGDDSSIHTRTTTKLISSIERIIDGIKLVEEKVNVVPSENDNKSDGPRDDIANHLRQIAVPLDLLDMMDFASGLNPDCFARGLIKEALRQMGNLQRRKASMKMLAITIQRGMNEREKQLQILASLDEKLAAGNDGGSAGGNSIDGSSSSKKEDEDVILEKSSDIGIGGEEGNKKRKRDGENAEEEPSAKR